MANPKTKILCYKYVSTPRCLATSLFQTLSSGHLVYPKFEGPKVIGFASVIAADLIKREENAYEY